LVIISAVLASGQPKRCARATLVATGIAVILFLATPAPRSNAAVAPAGSGTRVTVALFGDSVTESYLVPTYLRDGLAPQLARDVSALGFAPGGVGLIPAAPYRWHFNAWVAYGTRTPPPTGWATIGYGLTPGYDGPSAYSAITVSPLASATVSVSDPQVEVLYTSTNQHYVFKVSAAGRTWTIDTYRPGPVADTETPIELPPGRHELTVHGPSSGFLSFNGVIARRPVPPGRVQVEVDNLGHSGQPPWRDFNPRVRQSLIDQRYGISVFLWGYIGELLGTHALSAPYTRDLTARTRIARKHGGACLIVQPTPIEVPPSAVSLVSGLNRTIAHRAGCKYSTVLAHLWPDAATAERSGLLFVDGIHPTAAGYKLIAHALAPVLARMARARLHRSAPGS
jgi:lysophospholipase L1-like esterase